jgi:hypothetical protein
MNRNRTAQSDFVNLSSWLWAALVCVVGASAHANIITVTNINDSGPGSLRQALADANDGDTITFAVSGTIGLTSGELLVDDSITISGPGANMLTVSRASATHFRIFHVNPGHSVTIAGLTISNGSPQGNFPDTAGGAFTASFRS